MVNNMRSVFAVFAVFILFKHTLCLYPSKVVRDVKGDLLSFRCDSRSECSDRGKRCSLTSVCRDNKLQASCEGESCCMCRCQYIEKRPTYVYVPQQNKSVCVGNALLPNELNLALDACRWRLVAKREDGKSCQKEDVPVIGLNTPGNQTLALCTYTQQNAADLSDISSCVVIGRVKYFHSGKWNISGAKFRVQKTDKNLLVKWEEYSGVDSAGYIIYIDVKCHLRSQKGAVTACLLVKSSGGNATVSPPTASTIRNTKTASTTKNTKAVTIATTTVQLNLTTSRKTEARSSTTRPWSTRMFEPKKKAENNASAVVKRLTRTPSQNLSTTLSSHRVFVASTSSVEQTSPTEFTPVVQQDSNELPYVKVAIGCSVFVFCASVGCVLLILRNRKRRKLQSKHSKGNPLYVEGAIIPVIATNELNEMDKERNEMYQPLVENSKCKLTNKNVVYQALRKKGRSLDDLNEYSSTPENTTEYQSLQRKRGSHGAANKTYQSLSNLKENESNQADADERPTSLVYYSTPDTYKEPVMPVNKKLLKGYYEPGCVLLGQQTRRGVCAEEETRKPKLDSANKLEVPEYHELEGQPLYHELERH